MIVTLGPNMIDDLLRVWRSADLSYRPAGRDEPERLRSEVALTTVSAFGWQEQGTVVGVAMAHWDGRRGWINRLAVDPSWQDRGIARRLIEAAENWLKDRGALVIAMLIEDDRAVSQHLADRLGYRYRDTVRYYAKYQFEDA